MDTIKIDNRFWIAKNGEPFLGHGRILLLENIDRKGSINKAAKAMGMSYKRAWQIVSAINNLSDDPLVIRNTGGAGGGGTMLTEKGKQIISEFRRIDKKCRALLEREVEKCCF
jgi:molybdate transport system regulatory protein